MKRRATIAAMALMVAGITISACGTENENEKPDTEAVAQAEIETEPETETAIPEPEPEPEPVVQTLRITATGDCTFGPTQKQGYDGSFPSYYDSYGGDYFFEGVRDVFASDDFTLINLECVLTESQDLVSKAWNLKGKPQYVDIMTGSSVEACGHGNNHCMDYGEVSLTDTQEAVNGAGIVYARNDVLGVYTTAEGLTIGVVSVNLLSESDEDENYLKNGIETLRSQGVNLVIASCHWGIELDHYPTDYQQTMAHTCIDLGADLVIGNHPHVLQGVEEYHGKIICYSLGNFCFGGNLNPKDKRTMMYQQNFTFVDGVLQPNIDASVIPCTISGHSGYNDFQPTIAEGEKWTEILDHANTYSNPYGGVSFDSQGVLLIDGAVKGAEMIPQSQEPGTAEDTP